MHRGRDAVPYSVDGFRISEALPASGLHLTTYPSRTTKCRESRSNNGEAIW
jgi:hypothetical protein